MEVSWEGLGWKFSWSGSRSGHLFSHLSSPQCFNSFFHLLSYFCFILVDAQYKYKNTKAQIQKYKKRVLCHQKEDVWVGGCASKTGQKQEAPHLQPPAALLQITVRSKNKKNEKKGKKLTSCLTVWSSIIKAIYKKCTSSYNLPAKKQKPKRQKKSEKAPKSKIEQTSYCFFSAIMLKKNNLLLTRLTKKLGKNCW